MSAEARDFKCMDNIKILKDKGIIISDIEAHFIENYVLNKKYKDVIDIKDNFKLEDLVSYHIDTPCKIISNKVEDYILEFNKYKDNTDIDAFIEGLQNLIYSFRLDLDIIFNGFDSNTIYPLKTKSALIVKDKDNKEHALITKFVSNNEDMEKILKNVDTYIESLYIPFKVELFTIPFNWYYDKNLILMDISFFDKTILEEKNNDEIIESDEEW